MSGSSLDGLDIVFTVLDEVRGQWTFEIVAAACIPYPDELKDKLKNADKLTVPEFLRLNTSYGRYIGQQVNLFIDENDLHHKVHFIASHGHTVFHEPHNNTTGQIGDGATIAAVTGLHVISDLRALDVALGGQGAPIVPIGDKLLFPQYDYRLNIGGICNITVPSADGGMLAYDVCAANQVLNALAARKGKEMDENGDMARAGNILPDILSQLDEQAYYKQQPPKSMSNDMAKEVLPMLTAGNHTNADLLRTMVQHIAGQVLAAVQQHSTGKPSSMLVTGGGAFNQYLIERISELLTPLEVSVVVPDDKVVNYKEALIMALIGTLRWREETNVLSSVTGAEKDSIGGAIWMGDNYAG